MSEDTIYRQQALDAVDVKCLHRGIVEALQEIIKDLPSAQPERKTGHWLIKQDQNGSAYGECSQCHSIQYAGHTPYCHNCGAKMEGADD